MDIEAAASRASVGCPSLVGLSRRKSSIFKTKALPEPNFTWKVKDNLLSIVQADGNETSLLHTKHQATSMKNFGLEVRGLRDINNLLEEAVILLDPRNTSISDLVDEIIESLSFETNLQLASEIYSGLFINEFAQNFTNTLQGINIKDSETIFEPSWICSFCNVPKLKKRWIAIARLKQPTNFGKTSEEVQFFILILCPSVDKGTKTALETGRTFGTIFSDADLRQALLGAHNVEQFKATLIARATRLSEISFEPSKNNNHSLVEPLGGKGRCISIGAGIKNDLIRRLPHYISDYTDGVQDSRAIQKTISTSVFLYFACLLPTIAFATLNDKTTNGVIDVRKGIFAQTIGHLFFALFGGQHLNILLTTAPLCLFVKIIHGLAEFFDIVADFPAFYCCVGLWCSLFLFLSALFDLSKIMKWCTRSTEEIFALFISVAFVVYAIKDVSHNFQENYSAPSCYPKNSTVSIEFLRNHTDLSLNSTVYLSNGDSMSHKCHRDTSLLFVLLMLGTFWFGFMLYNFKNTPFLQASKRELLSDYALPVAVILFSFIGSYVFQNVPVEQFVYSDANPLLQIAQVQNLSWSVVLYSAILGFSLSVLIFMDQNIGAAIVNNPSNQLKKGPAYHWDLVIIAIINIFCSLFTLPWLHVALPHAPMHVKNLADIEERVENGQVHQTVVRVRETRLTGIISHVLMGLSLLLLPYPLVYIPISVFDGLYLYMGITALGGNQMFERILLIFTEQTSYPPNHYIRRVPQRQIHQFTTIQVLQLLLLCVLGFFPYPFVKVVFPLVLLLLLFIRHKVLPLLIEQKYLDVLD